MSVFINALKNIASSAAETFKSAFTTGKEKIQSIFRTEEKEQEFFDTIEPKDDVFFDAPPVSVEDIISGGEGFNKDEINNFFLSKIREGNPVAKITFEDGSFEHRTITRQDNLSDFKSLLNRGFGGEDLSDIFGSDQLSSIIGGKKIVDIEMVPFNSIGDIGRLVEPGGSEPQKRLLPKFNTSGNFFHYENQSAIDLTRAQILRRKDNIDILNENCFIYSLRLHGIEEHHLSSIKSIIISGSYFPMSAVEIVTGILGKTISIAVINGDGYVRYKNYPKICVKKCKKCTSDCNKNYDIHIGFIENHYFLNENIVDLSQFAVKNYNRVVSYDHPDDFRLCKSIEKSGRRKYIPKGTSDCTTFQAVRGLLVGGQFKKDSSFLTQEIFYTNRKVNIPLDMIKNEQHKLKGPTIKPPKTVFYADTETDTTDEHKPLMLAVKRRGDTCKPRIFTIQDENDCTWINDFFKYIHANLDSFINNNGDIVNAAPVVYFHNLKYDFSVLINIIIVKNILQKGSTLYRVKSRGVEFRDSYKMIPVALKKFTKMFDLGVEKKESIAYGYYKTDNMNVENISISEYSQMLETDYDRDEIFSKEVIPFMTSEDTFNPIAYYKQYLDYDVLTEEAGMEKFDEIISELTNDDMSVYDHLTISSLAYSYFHMKESFDGMNSVQYNLREYISSAIMGGKVQCGFDTRGKLLDKEIIPKDGNSLYPSGIVRICNTGVDKDPMEVCGFSLGPAKIWNMSIILTEVHYYIVTINITHVGKYQQVPMISYKLSNGSIKYTNEVPNCDITVDKTTLEDWVNFHHIKYNIVKGVYWDQGGVCTMGSVVENLFKLRQKYKLDGNDGMQNIIKLILNSTYGKTIQKKIYKKSVVVDKDKREYFIKKYHHLIERCNELNSTQLIFTVLTVDNGATIPHVGVSVLSMAKRIMHEVLNVANDLCCPVIYIDTDSMYFYKDDIKLIEVEYRNRYNRDIWGEGIGQFKNDLKLSGGKDLSLIRFMPIGLKTNYGIVKGTDETGHIIYGEHIKAKGMTSEGLSHAGRRYKDGMYGMYKALIKGNNVKILLNPPGKTLFNFKHNRVYLRKTGDFPRILRMIPFDKDNQEDEDIE